MRKVILIILICFVGFSAQAQYNVGSKADLNFTLPNASNTINGVNKGVNPSKDLKNINGVVVIFTCNTCPFSVAYEDRIIELHKKYAPKGYPVIAINPNDVNKKSGDSFQAMVARSKEKKFPFAYLRDESQKIAQTFGASRTPHFYILQKKGTAYVVRFIGALDDNSHEAEKVKVTYVEDAIEELMVGKKVTKNFVKAIGCSIKWKE